MRTENSRQAQNLTLVSVAQLVSECDQIKTYYGKGWFASATDNQINTIKTNLEQAISYISQGDYGYAIAYLRQCQVDDWAIIEYARQHNITSYRKLSDTALNNITYLVAFCEYQLGHYKTAFELLKTLRIAIGITQDLNTLSDLCFAELRKIADEIIDNHSPKTISKTCDIVACRAEVDRALDLYKLLEVRPSAPLVVADIKNKLEWLEIYQAVAAQALNIFSMVQTERDQQRLFEHTQACVNKYEKYQVSLDETEQATLHRLRQLLVAIEAKIKAESVEANRKSIPLMLEEIPELLNKGNYPAVLRKLTDLQAAANFIVTAYEQRDSDNVMLEPKAIEKPEYYKHSMRIIKEYCEQYDLRANNQIPDLVQKVITDALKFMPSSTTEKTLAKEDREKITNCLSNILKANWYKFDRREPFAYVEILLVLSKMMSQLMAWNLGVKTSLIFRGHNIYVTDLPKLLGSIQEKLSNYIPEANPPYLSLPIIAAANQDLITGDQFDPLTYAVPVAAVATVGVPMAVVVTATDTKVNEKLRL